jgi:hypothetical protein
MVLLSHFKLLFLKVVDIIEHPWVLCFWKRHYWSVSPGRFLHTYVFLYLRCLIILCVEILLIIDLYRVHLPSEFLYLFFWCLLNLRCKPLLFPAASASTPITFFHIYLKSEVFFLDISRNEVFHMIVLSFPDFLWGQSYSSWKLSIIIKAIYFML